MARSALVAKIPTAVDIAPAGVAVGTTWDRHTAARLFAERGIGATTTADIARAAGISHGAVFVHFPTRGDLLIAVAGQFAEGLTDRLHAVMRAGGSLRDALEVHLSSIAAVERLYTRFAGEAATLPPAARASWIGLQSAIGEYLSMSAEREMRSGALVEVPFALLFNTWLGLIHHYLIHGELFAPAAGVIERWGPTLIDHFLTLASGDRAGP